MDNMTTETDSSKLVTSLFEPVTNMDNMTTVLYYGAQLALVLGAVTLIDAVLRPYFAYSSPLLVEWDSGNGLYPAFRRQRQYATGLYSILLCIIYYCANKLDLFLVEHGVQSVWGMNIGSGFRVMFWIILILLLYCAVSMSFPELRTIPPFAPGRLLALNKHHEFWGPKSTLVYSDQRWSYSDTAA